MSYSVNLGGLEVEHPICNAAGTCKKLRDVERLAISPVSVVYVGSITRMKKPGNGGNVLEIADHYSINSLGLPNGGVMEYDATLETMVEAVHEAGKTITVSIAGESPEDNAVLARFCLSRKVDIIEVNLGCPNVWQGGEQKRIASYSPELVEANMRAMGELNGTEDVLIGYKFSPLEPFLLREITAVIRQSRCDFVTTANTFPNGLAYRDNGRLAVDSPDVPKGYGGVAGPGFKPIGLGQVAQFREELPEMLINGVGGVACGRDVLEYQRAGANGLVQVATEYFRCNEDPRVFQRLLEEYVAAREQASEPATA
jgi:dihydroorotate dehydrogenase (fumarate)